MKSSQNEARPFRTNLLGVVSIVWARSSGRARMVTALAAYDAGYTQRANPADVQCVRAKEYDYIGTAKADFCYSEYSLPKCCASGRQR